jgi:hypothetical protein
MRLYLADAIKSLRPGSEFSYINNDYSTVNWIILEGLAPTQAQINAEIERIKISETSDEANRVAAKAALLKRLGITADEAALLLS